MFPDIASAEQRVDLKSFNGTILTFHGYEQNPPVSPWFSLPGVRNDILHERQRILPRLVEAELKQRGWDEQELSRRSKAILRKCRWPRRLRGETIMTLKRMAERLKIGSWTYVSNLLRPATGRAGKRVSIVRTRVQSGAGGGLASRRKRGRDQ